MRGRRSAEVRGCGRANPNRRINLMDYVGADVRRLKSLRFRLPFLPERQPEIYQLDGGWYNPPIGFRAERTVDG